MGDGAISREEIPSGWLGRQRWSRLLLQRLLARTPRTQPVDGRRLLNQRAGWQSLTPDDRNQRTEWLSEPGQAVPCAKEQDDELTRQFAPAVTVATAVAPFRPAPEGDGGPVNQPRLLHLATWPVGIKLGGLLVLFSLLPALLVGNVGALLAQKQAELSGQKQLVGLADSVARGLNQEIRGYVELIRYLSQDPGVVAMADAPAAERARLRQPVLDLLDRLQKSHPHAVFTYLLDRNGVCIAASDPKLIGHDYSFRTYYERGLRQPFYVSGTYLPISTTDHSAAISIASPIRRGNAVVGVAVVATHTLANSSALNVLSGNNAMVVEADGLIASAKDPAMRLGILGPGGAQAREIQQRVSHNATIDRGQRFRRQLSYHPISASLQPLLGALKPGFGLGELDGEPVVSAWQPLDIKGWTVVVVEPHASFTRPTEEVQRRVVLLASLLGMVAMLAAIAASRTLSGPLRILTEAATQLETDQPVDQSLLTRVSRRRDDLGVLAARLLEACRQARKREASLKAQVATLHIEIDQGRRDRDVAVIVESEFFNDLKQAAAELRQQRRGHRRRPSPSS